MENGSRGTIAGTATSTCGTSTGCHYFTRACLNDIYRNGNRILGRVIFNAKGYVIPRYSQDSLYGPAVIYTLFGDPATRIKYPLTSIEDAPQGPRSGPTTEVMPNPFVSSALIRANGLISIYDTYGRKVKEMILKGSTLWDGRDTQGHRLPAGVYFLRSDAGQEPSKIVILY